jgi:hypothetical protein
LFEEEKRRLFDFQEQEIAEGNDLITVPNVEQKEVAPNHVLRLIRNRNSTKFIFWIAV